MSDDDKGDEGGAGGAGDAPITATQFAALTEGLDELRTAVGELRDARTPDERREAQDDVADARRDLDALAARVGIPRAQLDKAIADAKRAERKEELRPILAELLDELIPAGNDDGGKPKPDDKGDGGKPKPVKPDTPPDTPPAGGGHWSERPLRELIR